MSHTRPPETEEPALSSHTNTANSVYSGQETILCHWLYLGPKLHPCCPSRTSPRPFVPGAASLGAARSIHPVLCLPPQPQGTPLHLHLSTQLHPHLRVQGAHVLKLQVVLAASIPQSPPCRVCTRYPAEGETGMSG